MTDTQALIDEYGVPEPDAADYASDEAFWAAHDAWLEGFANWLQQKAEEEEAARAAEEEARRQAEEEEAARLEREEEAANEIQEQPPVEVFPEFYDPYPVGSYVDPAGNIWSEEGELLSPGTTPAMDPIEEDLTGEQLTVEPVTGEPTIDTALLLLDLLDAITGDDGMTNDVDGVLQTLDHPLMTTSFQDYTVTEGLLLLLLLSAFVAACAKILKGGFSWLR